MADAELLAAAATPMWAWACAAGSVGLGLAGFTGGPGARQFGQALSQLAQLAWRSPVHPVAGAAEAAAAGHAAARAVAEAPGWVDAAWPYLADWTGYVGNQAASYLARTGSAFCVGGR